MQKLYFFIISFLAFLIPWSVFADSGDDGHNMMGGFNSSFFSMGFGGIAMLIFWALIIAGIVLLVQWLVKTNESSSTSDNALEILKERFAKGEITEKKFQEMKKELEK